MPYTGSPSMGRRDSLNVVRHSIGIAEVLLPALWHTRREP